ncbi:MAG: DUF2203 domain-containing protein [Candidatus Dormibacteraeota bacterium]|nr:DUF2203 domain-containing protein [Candidatus Dormibacteraeota bacterium]
MTLTPPRTYTLDEANQALPEVRKLVERVVATYNLLPELQENARVADYKTSRPASGPEAEKEYERARRAMHDAELELADAALRLERRGVSLKDAQVGLIDFYSYREGELIELCWKLGEPAVSHWHRIGAGFAGREPI